MPYRVIYRFTKSVRKAEKWALYNEAYEHCRKLREAEKHGRTYVVIKGNDGMYRICSNNDNMIRIFRQRTDDGHDHFVPPKP